MEQSITLKISLQSCLWTKSAFKISTTLRCNIESLDQLGRIFTEKPLAVHDTHVGVATAVQDVDRVSHQQSESICCQEAQVVISEQREELRKMSEGEGITNSAAFNVCINTWHEKLMCVYLVSQCGDQRVVSKKQSFGNLKTSVSLLL